MFKIPAFYLRLRYLHLVPFLLLMQTDNLMFEEGVAGIAAILDKYHEEVSGNDENNGSIIDILEEEIISPYVNLGVSKANDYVNIRKEASTESEVVGKLYRGCATDILEWLDDGWVKIESGDVEGYIAVDYLATGADAEAMFDEYATQYATVVNARTLRVRSEASTEARIVELIPEGSTYIITKEHDEWVEILLGSGDDGEDFTGFIHKDYVEKEIEFNYAISIEEKKEFVQNKKPQQEQARKLQRLAEEEAARQEAERRAAEERAAAKKEEKSKSNSTPAPSTGGSGTGSEVASYAQKFVGNPYVWGGTSLRNGADCSGFVQTIYRQFGYSIPRTSREQARSAGVKVSLSDRKPGDLLFYTNSNGVVNHVAMYIGNNKIVHAANSRRGIVSGDSYNYRKVHSVRRVIN